MTRSLDVYFANENAGQLQQNEDGSLEFTYWPNYLSIDRAVAISVSMPLQEAPFTDRIARPYFSGLLPDEGARRQLTRAIGISSDNDFGLLEVIGGECAGALSLVPAGKPLSEPLARAPEPLSDKQLADILGLLRTRPLLGGMLDVRLSLAGAQNKLAVCQVDGRIALATGGQPTSHILKPAIDGLEGTVENEVFCMRLATKVGLNAPNVYKEHAGDLPYYLIERYDRVTDASGSIKRLHQEDFCQALSIAPTLKYEAEGGPGTLQSQQLIRSVTRTPAADEFHFLRMLMFHVLIGNADAHAKNYALLYRDKAPELSPVYDAICTAVYPSMSKRLAMEIGGRSLADTLQLKHWLTLVPDTQPAQRILKQELQTMSDTIVDHASDLATELRDEGIEHPIIGKIQRVIQKRAKQIASILRT
ncbi:MAG TPA: type II toxin-antitoxin system HipA family toxin [Orrella sp.]